MKIGLAKALLGACLLTLSACGGPTLTPSARSEKETISPHFSDFTDIPRPASATMDLDRTLIFGNADSWVGRLAFTSRMTTIELFDFFKQEMPRFGWEEVTSVRSTVSVLSYRRMDRVAMMQIKSGTLYGSSAELTVSPKGAPVGYSPGGGYGSGNQQGGGVITTQPLR
ncbi:MAG: hypothetical protein HQL44_14500 [Alphaproteobacteria bacterium]|nr:hypothetical protein [Alphaproteobacteria bacterium]